MKLPRDLDAETLIPALGRTAYSVVRQSGSHVRHQCDAPDHAITIPIHSPLRVGTQSAIPGDVADTFGSDIAVVASGRDDGEVG